MVCAGKALTGTGKPDAASGSAAGAYRNGEMNMMELCLGTVQFGMDYGIRGKRKPPLSNALDMLDYATQN